MTMALRWIDGGWCVEIFGKFWRWRFLLCAVWVRARLVDLDS